MKASVIVWISLLLGLLIATGCEVTEERIELWKGTQNGPKKLAGTVIDPEIDLNLRAKAAVALVEIDDYKLFQEMFTKMERAEAAKVIDAVAPRLAEMVKIDSSSEDKSISKLAVDAKDALYLLLDYAEGEGKATSERALIDWCVGDYNSRAMAGKYNIRTIVKKIGAPAADGLVPLLAVDQLVIKHVAELIRAVNDPKVLVKASAQLAKELKGNLDKIKEVHLVAAAIIGGGPIGDTFLDFATDNALTASLQRFSLRAFSESLNTGALKLSESQVTKLFSMAESEDYDQYQREETYYVIAQAGRKEDLPRLRKLLAEKDSFWRAVGFRCILRIDGEGQLRETLQEIARRKLTKDEDDVGEVISRIISFPKLLPKVRESLDDSSVFVKAVALGVLAKLGKAEDLKKIEPLTSEKQRLSGGFGYKTLGEAASAAVEAIKKRG